MRKESSNQFTEGLVCDLNPINTPNTVLTDALNATIITYDGNEFSLQNDRGNYPLENCRLKPNYIPVGLKEYGDILYIVSYNPLNEHVEIGSYPSPMEIINSKDNETSLDLLSVLDSAKNGDKYSDLIEVCESKTWISNNEEDSKLYPGDRYKIAISNPSEYKYETLEYYIVDDDRNKHNISNMIEFGDWYNVSWQVPGWLTTQYRLATFDDFSMNMRSLVAPSLSTNEKINCNIKLNFQFRISDPLFLPTTIEKEESIKKDLSIKLQITNNRDYDKTIIIPLTDGSFIDWYSDSKILWIDWEGVVDGITIGDILSITATPNLTLTTETSSKTSIYDSFMEQRSILLSSIGEYDDFKIGNELWKFYIDDSDDSLYIEYDITGPYLTTSEVSLYYKVFDIDDNELTNWNKVGNYTGVTNQGIGILPFDGEFVKEGMYVIKFVFYKNDALDEDLNKIKTINKFVIASKLFANFVGEYTNFLDIPFDVWINRYKDSIVSKNWKCNYSSDEGTDYSNFIYNDRLLINGRAFGNKDLNNLWNLNYKGEDKGLIETDSWKTIEKQTDTLLKGVKHKLDVNLKHNTTVLSGPLWNDLPPLNVKMDSYVDSKLNKYNRSELSEDFNTVFETVFGEQMNVAYESENTFDYIQNLLKIEEVPVMHVHFEGYKIKNLNDGLKYTYYNLGSYPNKLQYGKGVTETIPSKKYVEINNNLAKAIYGMLGTKQMGVLFSTICLTEPIGNRLQYRHGDSVLWEDKNGSNTWLYTYLVFRRNQSSPAVLIELSQSHGLWNIIVGPDNMPKLTNSSRKFDAFELLNAVLNVLCDNIVICSKNNSIKTGNVVKIKQLETELLPIGTLDVFTEEFDNWPYFSKSKTYNLLSQNSRSDINSKIGDICGELFTGVTSVIKRVDFFTTKFDNTNISSTDYFNDVKNKILKNNNLVQVSEDKTGLLTKLQRYGSNTKGVYWKGIDNKYEKLIELLHSRYSSSDSIYLSIESSNLADANVQIVKEKDGIIFARVDTETQA